MPRPRALLVLLLASGALPGADWLLRQGSRAGGAPPVRVPGGEGLAGVPFQTARRTRLVVNETATRECGAGPPATLPGRASEVLE